ncbi:protein takeout-like [Periplaneta americana]|uniref:protein takeout-like n=1 Tax=Periplaneta americana TaxID=6978 RepID=UPI0037E7BE96
MGKITRKNVAGALLLVLSFVLCSSASNKLPPKFPQCKRSDSDLKDCLAPAIHNAVKFMKNGIPSLQMLPIDPLSVKKISLEQGAGKPINFKLIMTDTTIRGITGGMTTSAKSDIKNRQIEFEVQSPVFDMEGTYELDGKFSLLPLKGNGKFKMALHSYTTNFKLKADAITKNGDVYWDVKSFDLVISNPKNLTVHFDNMFNGNKVLGDSTNKALNDNWEGFWEELRPSMQETFGKIFLEIIKVLFSKVPEKNLFLD